MTTNVPASTEATTPPWRGINHLALVTNDMDATVRFYHGTLGARLVATIGAPGFRHYFFEFGEQCTVAFFEYTDSLTEPFEKAAGVPDARAPQFDHLSFNVPDEDALLDLRRRLKSADCEVTDVDSKVVVPHSERSMPRCSAYQPRRLAACPARWNTPPIPVTRSMIATLRDS